MYHKINYLQLKLDHTNEVTRILQKRYHNGQEDDPHKLEWGYEYAIQLTAMSATDLLSGKQHNPNPRLTHCRIYAVDPTASPHSRNQPCYQRDATHSQPVTPTIPLP